MASDSQATAQLDWAEAVVSGGTLTLPLTEKASKRWVAEVRLVLERLAPQTQIDVGRERLVVAVAVGEEEDVKHLLESAVLEANSRLGSDDRQDGDPNRDDQDAAMTETFRSFAL